MRLTAFGVGIVAFVAIGAAVVAVACKPRVNVSGAKSDDASGGCGGDLALDTGAVDPNSGLALDDSQSVFKALDVHCADVALDASGPMTTSDTGLALSGDSGATSEPIKFTDHQGKIVATLSEAELQVTDYPDEDPAYFLQELAGHVQASMPTPSSQPVAGSEAGLRLQGDSAGSCTPQQLSDVELKAADLISNAWRLAHHIYCEEQCNPMPDTAWDGDSASVQAATASCNALAGAIKSMRSWLDARTCPVAQDVEDDSICGGETLGTLADVAAGEQ